MNKYRFALLRYLMGAINAVSPDATIRNNSLPYVGCETDRDVYGLDINALATKLSADGWDCQLINGDITAQACRKGWDCHLNIRCNWTYLGISTWAYKPTK